MQTSKNRQTGRLLGRSATLSLLAVALGVGCAQMLGIEEIEPWAGAAGNAQVGGHGANGTGGNVGAGGSGAQGGELPAGCTDEEQNGSETDTDCGGDECPACVNGLHCEAYSDCESRYCDTTVGPPGLCLACGDDENCVGATDTFCSEGACIPKLDTGEPCLAAEECLSDFCVDDVCCASVCDGGCEVCDAAGSEGTCTAVADGDGGDGSCAPYLCDGNSGGCPTSCAGAGDCLPDPDAYCTTENTCRGTKPLGTACQNGTECASDFCVDEVCCGTASCGTATDCDVCNKPSSLGTCATANDNASCDDGLYCNGWDRCIGGSCVDHAGDPCTGPDGDADCSESCNETSKNCSGNDPLGSACTDGAYCNGTDTCNASGSCAGHTGDPCPGVDGDQDCAESCDEDNGNCKADDPQGSSCDIGCCFFGVCGDIC